MSLDVIARQTRICQNCSLNTGYGLAVPGVGSLDPDIFVVAEAPGKDESLPSLYEGDYGKPLVGPAGHELQDIMYGIGLGQYKIFATNVLKHRPPNNRPPTDEEKEACRPYLGMQLALTRPKVIIALGKHASETLRILNQSPALGKDSSHRGAHFQFTNYGLNAKVFSTYHPSYACLRSPDKRPDLVSDLQDVLNYLRGSHT